MNLPSPLLALIASGAVTNLGSSITEILAAWTSQTRTMRRVTLPDHADPFTIADVPVIDPTLQGVERLIPMLQSALAEAQDELPLGLQGPREPFAADPWLRVLVVPAHLSDTEVQQLIRATTTRWPGCDDEHPLEQSPHVIRGDSTAPWQALSWIYQQLPRMTAQWIALACVDSLCDPAQLRVAADAGHLLQTGHAEGYVAGEGAACLYFQRVPDALHAPTNTFLLHRPSYAAWGTRVWPADQEATPEPLVSVIQQALSLAGMKSIHISHLMSDMDGSDWRASLESMALNQTLFLETGLLPHWRPATMLGQTGAAYGPLSWLIAIHNDTRRLTQINTVLSWAVDAQGHTAACVLERSPQ